MRIPSRRLPSLPKPRPGLFGWLMLGVLAAGLAYAGYVAVVSHPWATSAVVVAVGISAYLSARARRKSLATLAASRSGDSICEFARSFNTRKVDTWIIRAVYEQLQTELEHAFPKFPVHAKDRIEEDLVDDPDALDMSIAPAIAARTGRSLDNAEQNPYFGKVRTVEDLVFFFNAQPLKSAA